MKLEAVFTVKNNKLYTIADNSEVNLSTLKQIQIPWSTIEMEDEAYNEEYLAALRDELKSLESSKTFAILIPIVDKPLETPEQFELFTNAYNHTARRVKDAVSVAGYLLPAELIKNGLETGSPAADFIETVAIKHKQYVYFAQNENAEIAKKSPDTVVIL